MNEVIDLIIQDFRAKIESLDKKNKVLSNKLREYENKFSTYTKDQTKLFCKIQRIKVELIDCNLSKSGHNNHSDYDYFELGDIAPFLERKALEHNVALKFYTKEDKIYLMAVDLESGAWDQVSTRLLPFNRQDLPRGDLTYRMKEVQASETYARRQLLLRMFDIVEPVPETQETSKSTKKDKDTLQIPDNISEDCKDIFTRIKRDFGKQVPFNKTTVLKKLTSMKNHKKIDQDTYIKCQEIVKQ